MLESDKHDRTESTSVAHLVSLADGLGITEVGSVCLVVWHAAVTGDRFHRQKLALDDIVQRHPGRAGLLCVIEPSAPVPEQPMREATVSMIASYGERLCCVACVIEASGFRGAIVRSVLSGMSLLMSNHGPDVKFMPTVSSAAPWIASKCQGASVHSLLENAEALRSGLSTAPS